MRILAIETSCDETGLAVVEASGGLRAPCFRVIKNLVASQIKIHRPFGGVVPNLAKREHLKNLPILFRKIFGISNFQFSIFKQIPNSKFSILNSIGLIAVTVGPGLEPALWTGINFAQGLREKSQGSSVGGQVKLVGANHLEGHLYSFLLPSKKTQSLKLKAKSLFPAVALLVSGGHTILLKMDSLTKWKKLGETRDDAAGEAFDKVARMLGLPYPGGPEIERLAKSSPARRSLGVGGKLKAESYIPFPRPMMHDKSYDFSFSGLKTAVLYYLREYKCDHKNPNASELSEKKFGAFGWSLGCSDRLRANVATSFQQAAIDVLVHKTMRAAREFGAKSVILCGGVAANKSLRRSMKQGARSMGLKFFVPDLKYNLDNAAMIAAAGYMAYLRGKKYSPRSRHSEADQLKARGDLKI